MFEDRRDAGRRLAQLLSTDPGLGGSDVVVLGLPRGGVPVAAEVASVLGAPLDVLVVRKLGVPSQPELAMGAIGEGGVRVVDPEVVARARVDQVRLAQVEERERVELERRTRRYRAGRPPVPLQGKVVVIVDDGLATGSTARAACQVARRQGARRVVLAVPVAPHDWERRLGDVADRLVALEAPIGFVAVGQWYRDFAATADDEVVRLLAHAPNPGSRVVARQVLVPAGRVDLEGELVLPDDPRGVVAFAHGSGSSRHSSRNRAVARELVAAGFGVLLFDLLTSAEEGDRANVFDVALLGGRLADATRWLGAQPDTADLAVAYFGASTGAAAALWAAAEQDLHPAAVVSRGGRPDLAGPRLERVECPTLLLVGSRDETVLDLNEQALDRLGGPRRLSIVAGAGHLFEEPGALDEVAHLAISWFAEHLRANVDPASASS